MRLGSRYQLYYGMDEPPRKRHRQDSRDSIRPAYHGSSRPGPSNFDRQRYFISPRDMGDSFIYPGHHRRHHSYNRYINHSHSRDYQRSRLSMASSSSPSSSQLHDHNAMPEDVTGGADCYRPKYAPDFRIQSTRPPSRLLALPTELRLMIISYLLPDISEVPALRPHYPRGHADNWPDFEIYIPLRKDGSRCWPKILRVNKQIYAETVELLYKHRTFEITTEKPVHAEFFITPKLRLLDREFDDSSALVDRLARVTSLRVKLLAGYMPDASRERSEPFTSSYWKARWLKENANLLVEVLHRSPQIQTLQLEISEVEIYSGGIPNMGGSDFEEVSTHEREALMWYLRPFCTLRGLKEVSIKYEGRNCWIRCHFCGERHLHLRGAPCTNFGERCSGHTSDAIEALLREAAQLIQQDTNTPTVTTLPPTRLLLQPQQIQQQKKHRPLTALHEAFSDFLGRKLAPYSSSPADAKHGILRDDWATEYERLWAAQDRGDLDAYCGIRDQIFRNAVRLGREEVGLYELALVEEGRARSWRDVGRVVEADSALC